MRILLTVVREGDIHVNRDACRSRSTSRIIYVADDANDEEVVAAVTEEVDRIRLSSEAPASRNILSVSHMCLPRNPVIVG